MLQLDPGAAQRLTQVQGDAARPLVARPTAGELRWIDVQGQTKQELQLLAEGFGFHPLALEDCLHFDQRPKLEEYLGPEPYLFVMLHGFRERPSAGPGDDDSTLLAPGGSRVASGEQQYLVEPLELHAFLGKGYLVTVH